jgi:hypothetical protein
MNCEGCGKGPLGVCPAVYLERLEKIVEDAVVAGLRPENVKLFIYLLVMRFMYLGVFL